MFRTALGAFFDGAGADAVWVTSDDVIDSFTTPEPDANRNITRSIGHIDVSGDGLAFTPDDVMIGFSSFEYDVSGNRIRRAFYDDVGIDGVPFTPDDVPGLRAEYDPAL